tara:strand:+ start:117960 stop:118757 length:798 start_codon:yes stop_codon:yes gene_type:complete
MRIVCFILGLFISVNAFAFDYYTKNRVFVGGKTYFRHYSEELVSPKKSDEYGFLYGLTVGFQHKAPESFLYELDLDLDFGTTTYDGSLQNWYGDYMGPWKGKTRNIFFTVDSKLGYTFYLGDRHLLTPFVGYGTHAWARDLVDELETYALEYASAGLQYDYMASPQLQYGVHVKFMPMLNGNMEAESTSAYLMTLGNKLHFEISLPIIYKLKANCKNHLRITPYYRNQKFGQSDSVSTYNFMAVVYEPASQNHVIGLKVDYGFGI